MFLISATIVVGVSMYWLLFCAPKIPTPHTVNFILVEPIKQQKEEEKVPFWLTGIIVGIIMLCQLYPVVGGIVLVIIGGIMLYRLLKTWAVTTRKQLRTQTYVRTYTIR